MIKIIDISVNSLLLNSHFRTFNIYGRCFYFLMNFESNHFQQMNISNVDYCVSFTCSHKRRKIWYTYIGSSPCTTSTEQNQIAKTVVEKAGHKQYDSRRKNKFAVGSVHATKSNSQWLHGLMLSFDLAVPRFLSIQPKLHVEVGGGHAQVTQCYFIAVKCFDWGKIQVAAD